jgi:hypothetical protein
MNLPTYACTICHVARHPGEPWFLVMEKSREDKLRVLEWDDRLAALPDIRWACSAFHVQQLVAHWMTTGKLGYPMAEDKPAARSILPWPRVHRPRAEAEESPGNARPLGELSVHRESLNRILQEQPESLFSVLEALMSALRRSVLPEAEAAANPEEEGASKVVTCPQ